MMSKQSSSLPYSTSANGSASPSHRDAVPALLGMPLKYVSLFTLAIQNASLAIVMHYSRVYTPPSQAYSAASAVLLNELLKGFISGAIAFSNLETERARLSPSRFADMMPRFRLLGRMVFSQDCWKLSIPAILYVIQNNLQYVAASNLDAATFQVTYQMKILTTAGFSVLLLGKRLNSSKWLALLLLAIGVGIVQIQSGSGGKSTSSSTDTHQLHPLRGFLAVTTACMTSGLAGVYFEMVLKGSQTDLWVRNVQLSSFSLLPALVPVLFAEPAHNGPRGIASGWFADVFRNFGFWAWLTVGVQVFGGLVTAVVIKYSDNILKGFATSLSIVISFLASIALFEFRLTLSFVVGSSVVLGATWLYNQPEKPSADDGRPGLVARRTNASSGSLAPAAAHEPILGAPRSEKRNSGGFGNTLSSALGRLSRSSSATDLTQSSGESQQGGGYNAVYGYAQGYSSPSQLQMRASTPSLEVPNLHTKTRR